MQEVWFCIDQTALMQVGSNENTGLLRDTWSQVI